MGGAHPAVGRWRQPNDAGPIDPDNRPSRRPRDVYVYFDNDAKVRAPYDARNLIERLRSK